MEWLGGALVRTPPDPDGLWIDRTVAAALDQEPAMCEGFRVGLWNSRGAHSPSAGRQELALAAKYRQQADDLDDAEFYQLADSLRVLANAYTFEADRDSRTVD
jgi:hypothetical protein